eukprot:645892_1
MVTMIGMVYAATMDIRLKYFPTYCDEDGIKTLDMLFYTKMNMKLHGVRQTLPKMFRKKIKWNERIEQRIHEDDIDFAGILDLPNHEIPSDHLPIGAILQMDSLCDKNNNTEVCQCSVEKSCKRKRKLKKNKHKMTWREYGNGNTTEWR